MIALPARGGLNALPLLRRSPIATNPLLAKPRSFVAYVGLASQTPEIAAKRKPARCLLSRQTTNEPVQALGLQQVGLRFVAMLLEIAHERRAPGADLRIIASALLALLVDIARRIFEMTGAEVRNGLNIGVIRGI